LFKNCSKLLEQLAHKVRPIRTFELLFFHISILP
jgi:hypothetical protein